MNGEGITQGESKIRSPSSARRNKKDENQSGEAEEGRKGKWIGAASEQSIGERGRPRRGTRERKVNGEFNLVWQPPFPLRRKKRNDRERGEVHSKFSNFVRVQLSQRESESGGRKTTALFRNNSRRQSGAADGVERES